MNLYLLQLVSKWFSLLAVSIMSSMGFTVTETSTVVTNENVNKNINVMTQVVSYETQKTYDSSLPSNKISTISEGKNGLISIDGNGNTIVLSEKIDEQIVVGTGAQSEYTGVITGYGPDCSTCSGIGNVACKTRDKKNFNLINDGIYYQDEEYGSVRILAAALSKFPCGTIIKVSNHSLGEFTGIVLDTGYDMRRALDNGIYHIDVAFKTERDDSIPNITDMRGTVQYSVQRWGW